MESNKDNSFAKRFALHFLHSFPFAFRAFICFPFSCFLRGYKTEEKKRQLIAANDLSLNIIDLDLKY